MRRFNSSEAGFTLVEVMVAALILVIGSLALGTVLINGSTASAADVQESQLINAADQQIEQVRAAVAQNGFDSLGLASPTALPAAAQTTVQGTWMDPDKFLSTNGSCFEIASNYDSVNTGAGTGPYGSAPAGFTPWTMCSASSTSDYEPLQTLTSGAIITTMATTATPCPSGAVSGLISPCTLALTNGATVSVYTYVTATYECTISSGTTATTCPNLSGGSVATTCLLSTTNTAGTTCSDARRVTVAVVPDNTHIGGRVTPVYISSIFTNPNPSTNSQGLLGLKVNLGGL